MNRRFPLLAALLIVLTAGLARAQDFSEVEMKATPVAGSVYVLQGAGGNIGVSVGEDGVLLVDDQFAPLADKIRAAVEELGGGAFRYVLNTHWHGDHTSGNPEFGGEATIISHRNVRERVMTEQALTRQTYPALPPEGWPVITFDHGLSVHFNGEEIRAIHFPEAHTDGDAVIHFMGSNVVHMGDLYFAGKFPFVDLESGGTVDGFIEAIDTIVGTMPADAKFIAGHMGPVTDLAALKTDLAMLHETRAIVAERMANGMDVEAVKAAGLPEAYASYDWGFIGTERWLETLFVSASDK